MDKLLMERAEFTVRSDTQPVGAGERFVRHGVEFTIVSVERNTWGGPPYGWLIKCRCWAL